LTLLFVVELKGGLANRLRALWSAHAFALRYRRAVVVLWPLTAELATPNGQLFNLVSPVRLITVNPSRPLQRLALRLSRWLFSSFRLGLNRPVDPGEAWGRPLRFAPLWMPFQWIQTCAEFEDCGDQPAPFQPLPSIQRLSTARLAQARQTNAPLVGVHIRRGDHRHAIANSTTSAFLTAMHERLIASPTTHFLLCTDDPLEVGPLRAEFGERLFASPPACLDRSHPQAGIDAFVEFLTLAGCDAILGSLQSSFSLLAARIGSVPISIVVPPDGKVVS
jgi:hypothetical protein